MSFESGPKSSTKEFGPTILASLYSFVFSEFPTMDIYCFYNLKIHIKFSSDPERSQDQ